MILINKIQLSIVTISAFKQMKILWKIFMNGKYYNIILASSKLTNIKDNILKLGTLLYSY